MFSIVYPDSDNELRPIQERRILYLELAEYERLRRTEFDLAHVAFRFVKCPLVKYSFDGALVVSRFRRGEAWGRTEMALCRVP